MNSGVNPAFIRTTHNFRSSSSNLSKTSPNPYTNPLSLTNVLHRPPSVLEQGTMKGLATTFQNHTDYSKQPIRNPSPPPQFSKGTIDVLAKANEILQKSSKIVETNNNSLSSIIRTNKNDFVIGDQGQNISSKTTNVLSRVNEILKKSTSYSEDTINPPTNKDSQINQNAIVKNKELFGNQNATAISHIPPRVENQMMKPPLDRGNKPTSGSLLSRIDEALQKSLQITSGPTTVMSSPQQLAFQSANKSQYERAQISNGGNFQATKLVGDTLKKPEFETPNRNSSAYPSLKRTEMDVQKSDIRNSAADDINKAYHQAIIRSRQNLEEKEAKISKANEVEDRKSTNLKSSLVTERHLNIMSGSPPETNRVESHNNLENAVLSPPGVYLPERKKKPKFVEEYYEDKTAYKGEKIKDFKFGRGEFIYADGSKFEGEWENDMKNGYGIKYFTNGNIEYDGEWKDDTYHGNGILMNGYAQENPNFDFRDFDTLETNWIKYEGEFVNGKMQGLGTLTLFNNERYVGKFKYDQVHGAGVFHKYNGDTISGEWENNKLIKFL